MVFSEPNMVNDFCNWLFSPQHQNVIAIAHNARAYDAYFLYNYLLNQSITPNIIFQGSKIMYCHVGVNLNIKLLDSLNFLSMALSRLPESFGLKEMKKGHFPHLYSTEEILSCPPLERLPHLPDVSFYDPDNINFYYVVKK